ncbi:MAG: ATP-binding protein involved in chromosome partitioning, partial [bacterium]
VNLALALKSLGKQVSLFDADIYGPSVPMMIGARDIKPDILGSRILPIQQYGIDFLSMGSLVDEDASLVWRGPMVHQAIEQMLRDTTWPGGDYLIMDMPPGTGDIQISLAQMTEVLGVVIVCTPQDVALLDAKRAIVMFEKVDIPILGMIENMSSFICPHCKEETPIFSKGGTEEASKSQDVPFIGKIPIELDIRIGGDEGKPVVHSKPDSDIAKIFIDIAKKVDQLSEEVE